MRSCKEISSDLASGEAERLSWRGRLGCWMHFLMCPHCRRYRDQLEEIGEAARITASPADPAAIERLEAALFGPLKPED